MASNDNDENNNTAKRLAAVITSAWAVSFIVDIIDKAYEPHPSVHALMMLVAGAVFGEGLIKTRNGRSAPDKEDRE